MPWSEKTMLKTRENELLPSAVRTWGWACVRRVDLAYMGRKLEETLTSLIKYTSNRLGPQNLTNVFSTQRALF